MRTTSEPNPEVDSVQQLTSDQNISSSFDRYVVDKEKLDEDTTHLFENDNTLENDENKKTAEQLDSVIYMDAGREISDNKDFEEDVEKFTEEEAVESQVDESIIYMGAGGNTQGRSSEDEEFFEDEKNLEDSSIKSQNDVKKENSNEKLDNVIYMGAGGNIFENKSPEVLKRENFEQAALDIKDEHSCNEENVIATCSGNAVTDSYAQYVSKKASQVTEDVENKNFENTFVSGQNLPGSYAQYLSDRQEIENGNYENKIELDSPSHADVIYMGSGQTVQDTYAQYILEKKTMKEDLLVSNKNASGLKSETTGKVRKDTKENGQNSRYSYAQYLLERNHVRFLDSIEPVKDGQESHIWEQEKIDVLNAQHAHTLETPAKKTSGSPKKRSKIEQNHSALDTEENGSDEQLNQRQGENAARLTTANVEEVHGYFWNLVQPVMRGHFLRRFLWH